MKLLQFSFVLLVLLSSCSNVSVAPSATVTLTAAPTATPSPYPKTETPAPTITPEGLKIPELTKEKLAVIDWADFTPATWEDIAKLREYILNNPTLDINNLPMKIYPAEELDGGTFILVSCKGLSNCKPRFAVSMDLLHGTAHLLIMEAIVKNPDDGTNRRVTLTIAKDPQNMTQLWNDGVIKEMRGFSTIVTQKFRIALNVPNFSHYTNPLIPDIADSSDGPLDPNRQQVGSGYFDENTWRVILWILSQF